MRLCSGMAAHVDINKSHEVANEVRRINKQLKECQDLAAVYNNRERLFGMPVTNVSLALGTNAISRHPMNKHNRATLVCSVLHLHVLHNIIKVQYATKNEPVITSLSIRY